MVRRLLLKFGLKRPPYDVITTPTLPLAPKRSVPMHIERPPYAALIDPVQPQPGTGHGQPPVLNAEDISCLREACAITKRALDFAATLVAPGVKADDIDAALHEFIIGEGAYPSPLGYLGFPKSVCISVNNVICHGIPDSRALLHGDVVSIDVTSYFRGFHGDSCRTFIAGATDVAGTALVEAARECLHAGLRACRPGAAYSDIGRSISSAAQKRGVSVCREFIGHGVGRTFHCPPQIFHFSNTAPGTMQAHTAFTIEPCILERGRSMRVLPDGWTAVSEDGGRAAQFEHTVLITEKVSKLVLE